MDDSNDNDGNTNPTTRTKPSRDHDSYSGQLAKTSFQTVDGDKIFYSYGSYDPSTESYIQRHYLKWWAERDMVRAEEELLEDQEEHSIVLDRCSFSQESTMTQIPWREFVVIVLCT